MPKKLGIEVKSDNVNVEDLHPEFRARIRLAQNDDRLSGNLSTRLSSGARTYNQQKWLYQQYRKGLGNLAANPDRISSSGVRGSFHMVQPENGYKHGNLLNVNPWAYAMDIGFWKGSPTLSEQIILREVLGDYGLYAPIVDKGEWWHFVPTRNSGLVGLTGRNDVGNQVRDLQKILQIPTDGVYGPQTQTAVEELQQRLKIQVTGDWTLSNQNAFEESLKNIGVPTIANGNDPRIFPITVEDEKWVVTLHRKR